MFCDYHVHTEYSDDSVYKMEDVIQDAIHMGMEEICITDHVDYGVKADWDEPEKIVYRDGMPIANVDYPKYYEEIMNLQKKYQGQIKIHMGMEFGMQRHTIQSFQQLFDRYPFEFIILSCHQVEDKEFWTQDFQRGKTQQEYNEQYYKEILHVIRQYKDYSVLGHLDMIVRYDEQGVYPFEKLKDILTEILKTVIADGKGIEVNTSSHRYGLPDLTPSRDILKLYKELGGSIVTIGSDSHKKEHLGAYIKETREELKKLGFTSFCTFEHMKPIFHKL